MFSVMDERKMMSFTKSPSTAVICAVTFCFPHGRDFFGGGNGWEAAKTERKKIMSVKWKPISTFDSRMFSLMTNGTEDCTAVVKYKGHVPE